jgi:glycosyltransferase involved in cell wall biosynthesis
MSVSMMIQPLVSFVIPVFNSENDIARCLLAIRNLQCPKEDYDLVIMDNGSLITPIKSCLTWASIFRWYQVNVSALRNRGAALARGQYLAFIDSDVELSPHWLQKALEGFADPQVVACGCFPRVPKALPGCRKPGTCTSAAAEVLSNWHRLCGFLR